MTDNLHFFFLEKGGEKWDMRYNKKNQLLLKFISGQTDVQLTDGTLYGVVYSKGWTYCTAS